MDLYDQNLTPRIVFTIITVVLTIGPTIADFNKTHATHPDWTGHARFHVVWQVLGFYPIMILNLIVLWINISNFYYPYQLFFWLFWYVGFVGSFLITLLSMPLFKGKLSDPGGRTPFLYTFGKKFKLLPGKDKHLPFKINGEVKTYKVDENLHNLVLPSIIVVITSIYFIVLLKSTFIFEYFFPLLLLCIIQSGTPGPNNIMLTASGKNFGYVKTIPHMTGVVFGFLTLLIVMGLGLISVFTSYPIAQTILQILGSLYLLYLSYRIYFTYSSDNDDRSKPITFIESSLFQYVNPKGVMMAITPISIYTDYKNFEFIDSFLEGMVFVLLGFTISNTFSVLTWTSVGVFLNNFIKSKAAIRNFNGLMATLLVLTVIWINYEFYGS